LGLSWEYWRNIFSGVLIKFNDQFNEGDFVSTDVVTGTFKKIYLSRSELMNEKGELVFVPNHKLRDRVVTHLHKTHDVNICIFNVRTTNDQPLENIYQLAHYCPYISANQEISVEKKQKNNYVIKATIIDNTFTEYANDYFENSIYFDKPSELQE
jgi:small-conductance mechanosensitive channel